MAAVNRFGSSSSSSSSSNHGRRTLTRAEAAANPTAATVIPHVRPPGQREEEEGERAKSIFRSLGSEVTPPTPKLPESKKVGRTRSREATWRFSADLACLGCVFTTRWGSGHEMFILHTNLYRVVYQVVNYLLLT